MATASGERIVPADARLRGLAHTTGGSVDALSSYRCLALTVIKLALSDAAMETASPADRGSAREFLVGSRMMRQWCRVAGLDPAGVIELANHPGRRNIARTFLSHPTRRRDECRAAHRKPLATAKGIGMDSTDSDSELLMSASRMLETFAHRLPEGTCEDDVRRALTTTMTALRERCNVETAVRQLVGVLHQLDEGEATGTRREFQRNVPAVGRLLEALQEDLLPLLRRAGYQV